MKASLRTCGRLWWLALLLVDAAIAQQLVPGAPAPAVDREIQVASDAFTKNMTLPSWVQPHAVPDAVATGPMVVQLADTQIMIAERPTTYSHRAVKINDALILSQAGRVQIPFIPEYQKLVLHTLRVVRDKEPLDRLQSAQVRFLQRETGLERNVYSGVVTASILIDDLRVGDTLELAYSTIGANPVFDNRFSEITAWDQPLPTELRRVIVNAPLQRKINWKFLGDASKPSPSPRVSSANGVSTTVFEEKSLSAIVPETAVPAGFSTYRALELSEYANWNEVAKWASGLFAGNAPASPERIALVAKIAQKQTTEERAVAALEFVQSQVRYFSVSLGQSSHRPAAPDVVIARRYGDCKDKSLLLIALLKDLGMDSKPVLARLGNRTGFDSWLPTPYAFDHVIVELELNGVKYFLDPTRLGQHGRLARMGQVHDGAQVLVAAPDATGLDRIIVANRDELVLNERSDQMTIANFDGDADLVVTQVVNGVLAESLRIAFAATPRDRIVKLLENGMEGRYPGAKLVGEARLDDDADQNRATLTTRFVLPKVAERLPDARSVKFRPENFDHMFSLPRDSKRVAPVAVLRHPAISRYTLEIQFPEDVSATFDPVVTKIDDRYFLATVERSFRGNRARTTAEFKTLADRIPAGDVARVREDLEKLGRALGSAVVVRDADIKRSDFLGLGKKDLPETLKSRQEEKVEKISATIKSDRLTGSDLARAYCDRSAALASLGQDEEARKDADEAVKLAPNSPDMLACRAGTDLYAKDFKQAIDDTSGAISLGAEGGHVYYQRGQARFFQKRFPEAAEDFAKANTLDKDARTTLYHDLWRAAAYRRMQQPLPEELVTRAKASPRGEWPRPGLAMLAGLLPPEEMLMLVQRKTGDEMQLDEAEAWFYIGQHYLSAGDSIKAREAFTASRSKGVIIYTEHLASGLELDQLSPAQK